MNYIKDGVYPISEAQIRSDHPNTSFPQVMLPSNVADLGYMPVAATPQPQHDAMLQNCAEAAPAFINGAWVQIWALSQASAADIESRAVAAVQQHLNQQAQLKGYDDIVSACSYAGAPNPFQVEGQSFVAWRGNCWNACHTIMAAVLAGTQAMPTAAQLVAQLPVRV